MQNRYFIYCLTLLLLISFGCDTFEPINPSDESSSEDIVLNLPPVIWNQKGAILTSSGPNGYSTKTAQQMVDTLRVIGVNSIAIIATWYQPNKTATVIGPNPTKTPNDKSLSEIITYIHNTQINVFLQLLIKADDGTWCGSFQPTSPDQWFQNYSKFVDHYSRFAEQEKVEILSIGSELSTITSSLTNVDQLTQIIRNARQIYHGQLTYSANWGENNPSEWKRLRRGFWGDLDYMAINAYFPLSRSKTPTVQELINGGTLFEGRRWFDEIQAWQVNMRKPVIFGQIGYQSQDFAAEKPWELNNTSAYNGKTQANCYEAFFRVFGDKSWMIGAYFWQFTADSEISLNDIGYSPFRKPATAVLKAAYNTKTSSKLASRFSEGPN